MLPTEAAVVAAPPTTGLTEVGGAITSGVFVGVFDGDSSASTGGDPGGNIGAPPGGKTVEVVESVKSPPTPFCMMILSGTLHGPVIGRIEGPPGRQDARSG